MIAVIGAFDGFHKGHQTLFSKAREMSINSGMNWKVLTFSPHPQQFFSGNAPSLLFVEHEKDLLRHYFKIPEICYLKFDEKMMNLSPESFVDKLEREYEVSSIIVGENFRFGKDRRGTIGYLEYLCRKKGWPFRVLPLLQEEGHVISSSSIRGMISCGQVENARNMLGYPFFISQRVIHGDKRGRSLGYPTANIMREHGKVVPADGVYSGLVKVGKEFWPSAINIGVNPTFSLGDCIRIEAHLIRFCGDLYDNHVQVFFLNRLRGELAFHSVEALTNQIKEDTRMVMDHWNNMPYHEYLSLERFIRSLSN